MLFAFVFVQCKSSRKTESPPTVLKEVGVANVKSNRPMQKLSVVKSYEWPGFTDPFTINSVRVSGDTLLVEVSYSGGCKDHEFSLKTTGVWMKSQPPQLSVWLEHVSNGDGCRAMITETLKFDVREARYSGSEEVILIINEERDRTLIYSY